MPVAELVATNAQKDRTIAQREQTIADMQASGSGRGAVHALVLDECTCLRARRYHSWVQFRPLSLFHTHTPSR